MNSIIDAYNEVLNKDNIELEISYNIIKSIDLYKEIFNKLKKLSSSIEIVENLDIYYTDGVRKTMVFVDGVNQNKDIIIKKQPLAKSFIIKRNIRNSTHQKIKLNIENPSTVISNNIKIIRLKLRLRFILSEKFNVELDLVKNINNKESHLKEIKDNLFRNYKLENIIENINYSLFDELKLETEFKSKDVSIEDVFKCIDFVSSLMENDIEEYQKNIFRVAKYIVYNKTYLENFRYKSGLKKLLNNVIELNSDTYYKAVLPDITKYYITDKIDGQRCICIIDEYENNKTIKLLTNKLFYIKEFNNSPSSKLRKTTILDCECIIKDNKSQIISIDDIELYIFDIISYENEKLGFKPFEYRINYLVKGSEKLNYPNCNVKEYVKLTNNYKKELPDFYNKKLSSKYSIDGIIFTPSSEARNKNIKFNTNTNYSNMIGYKWKPIEHMTIDFYVKKVPDNILSHKPFSDVKEKNKTTYVLFSGISKYDYSKLGISFMHNYDKIVGEIQTGELMPIQFSTSDKPNNYIFVSKEDNLDNRICEMSWDKKWIFKKIRIDRDVELKRGEYYGNYYKVAEMIWNNIQSPLTLDMLTSTDKSYFTGDTTFYKSQRGFNSFVKSHILDNIVNNEKLSIKTKTNNIIDLAAGRGQDMARLANLNFKNALFLDNDTNALSELINRKHNLKAKKGMNIFSHKIDLTDNYINIIKQLEQFESFKKNSADIIICNFAIHYLVGNTNNINNLIQLINYYLIPSGRFIFTCFDGQVIYDLLKTTGDWNAWEDSVLKYSIKANYILSDELLSFGQKINVLLPFSNGEYYEEYLVNIEYISKCFTDNGFNLEITGSFSQFLNIYKNTNPNLYSLLTPYDKEFVSLYSYVIFQKNMSETIISKSNIKNILPSEEKIGAASTSVSDIHLLDNINNSSKILFIINTEDKQYTKLLKSQLENLHYRDLSDNNRNKKNVFKILYSINLIDSYKKEKTKYDSIVILDAVLSVEKNLFKLIKKPIIPIVIAQKNTFVISTELFNTFNDLEDILNYMKNNTVINC